MTDYNEEQQELAREASEKLAGMAAQMLHFMTPHAIATAFIGVGVPMAGVAMKPEQVAEWLRGLADAELEKASTPEGRAH